MALTLGIIGTNFISDWLCEAAKIVGIPLGAVYSRGEDTGAAFAAKHGIGKVYTDFEAFLSSDTFGAGYVASPNAFHTPQTIALLNHGKHVLCEKPIAARLADFDEMHRAALMNHRVLLEAMRPEFDPALGIIRSALPRCGALRHAVIEYSQYSSRYDRYKNGVMTNAFEPTLENAAIMDIGVYPLHIALALFGRPRDVISRSVMLPNGFEGQGQILLCYDGFTCNVVYSKITEAHLPAFIRGEDAEVSFGHALSKINLIEISDRFGAHEKLDFTPAENNMIYELKAFEELIENGTIEHPYFDTTRLTVEVIEEVRRQNGICFPRD